MSAPANTKKKKDKAITHWRFFLYVCVWKDIHHVNTGWCWLFIGMLGFYLCSLRFVMSAASTDRKKASQWISGPSCARRSNCAGVEFAISTTVYNIQPLKEKPKIWKVWSFQCKNYSGATSASYSCTPTSAPAYKRTYLEPLLFRFGNLLLNYPCQRIFVQRSRNVSDQLTSDHAHYCYSRIFFFSTGWQWSNCN